MYVVISAVLCVTGASTVAGCRQVLGIEEKSCNQCVSDRERIACVGDHEPRAEHCAGTCLDGECLPCPEGLGAGDGGLYTFATPGTPCADRIVSLSASHSHVCAVKADGSVWCWGDNGSKQLGIDPNPRPRTVPLQVRLPGPAFSVNAGTLHTCAIVQATVDSDSGAQIRGDVYCWGSNIAAQLGPVGALGDRAEALRVDGLPSIVSVSGGGAHTCALADDGRVFCWGANYVGQSGLITSLSPTGCESISSADPTGAIANLTNFVALSPVEVPVSSSRVQRLVAMKHHSCALTADRDLHCWGSNCADDTEVYGLACAHGGQLGTDPATECYRHQPVTVMSQVVDFALGYGAVYAVRDTLSARVVESLGTNENGELGNANPPPASDGGSSSVPVRVRLAGSPRAVFSSEGSDGCAALTLAAGDGALGDTGVSCWGKNHCGELGPNAACKAVNAPTEPSNFLSEAFERGDPLVARGDDFGCAVFPSHPDIVKCWGDTVFFGTNSSGCTCTTGKAFRMVDVRLPETVP